MEPQCVYRQSSRWFTYFGICLLSIIFSTASALELTAEEQAWLAEHPVIHLGIDSAWPPYEFLDEAGQYQGISADYLAIVSSALGVKFEVGTSPVPWSETQKKLQNQQLDLTPSIAEMPKRREFLNFTQPYISFPVVILTRVDEPFIGQLEDLAGQRVGVATDYYADEILKVNYPNISPKRYPFLKDLLSALSLGQVDYILTNYASASYVVQNLQMTGLKLAAVTPYQSPLAMGVRKDWPIFTVILNKVLSDITPEQHQKIRQKWLSTHTSARVNTDIWRLHPDVILLTVVVIFVVLVSWVVLYFRHRLLKRQLAAQKIQQDLAESEKRFRLLIEHAPIAFAIFKGHAGVVKMLNRCFVNTFGYKPNELYDVEDWWRCAYPNPAYREEVKKIWFERLDVAKKNHHNLLPMEATVRCRDGSERYIRFHSILIGTFNLVAFIDLTEQKNNETALRAAKEAAEHATKAKSLFLANMSHEIRTPMNGILGLTALLVKTELNERQRDYLTKVYSSGEFLLGILNDILDLSKVEAGKLELESQPFTLNQLLEPLRSLSLSATQAKPVEIFFYIAPDVPKILLGDVLRLGQIMTNLLGNAIKFSTKGEIEIGVSSLPTSNSQLKLHLWVRDTGIGMTSVQLSNIFEAFNQADTSTTRRFGGTGLGLTICQRLVELMEGEIRVTSQPNQGSRFDVFVQLPVLPQEHQEPMVTERKLYVLIIDENAHVADAIRVMAERLGWQADVMTALSQQQQPISHAYDFILLGASLADDRHNEYLPKDTPKVLLQTAWQENDPMLGGNVAFSHTLTKPVTEATLQSLTAAIGSKNSEIEEKPLLAYRILLVEDNTINQLVGVRLLESLGAEVDVAENGYVALSLLQQVGTHYDVVLMDLQMPVMDGLETTRQLRMIEQFADLPIIAMTANVMATDREQCFDAGMNDFMSKPVRLQELREKVLQWIAH